MSLRKALAVEKGSLIFEQFSQLQQRPRAVKNKKACSVTRTRPCGILGGSERRVARYYGTTTCCSCVYGTASLTATLSYVLSCGLLVAVMLLPCYCMLSATLSQYNTSFLPTDNTPRKSLIKVGSTSYGGIRHRHERTSTRA